MNRAWHITHNDTIMHQASAFKRMGFEHHQPNGGRRTSCNCTVWLTFHSNPPTAMPPAAPVPAKPTKWPLPMLLANRDAPTWIEKNFFLKKTTSKQIQINEDLHESINIVQYEDYEQKCTEKWVHSELTQQKSLNYIIYCPFFVRNNKILLLPAAWDFTQADFSEVYSDWYWKTIRISELSTYIFDQHSLN